MSIEQIQRQQHLDEARYERRQDRAAPEEPTDNQQLLVPAGYAALGGTFELLMLMLEASKAQKDGVRSERVAVEAQLRTAQAEQVDTIRSKASQMLGKAVAGAALTAASSAASFSSAIDTAKLQGAESNMELLKQKAAANQGDPGSNGALLDAMHQHQSMQKGLAVRAAAGQYASQMLTSARTLSDGGFDGAITHKDADATEHGNKAEALKRSADKLSSDLDQIEGNEGKLISYVRDIEAARTRCTQIALQSR